MNTTITGTRLQDDTGADFLVINVPWRWLATPLKWQGRRSWRSVSSNSPMFWRFVELADGSTSVKTH